MVEPLKAQQRRFARAIRYPGESAVDLAIESRRVAVYQELFFNNVSNFVDQGFPVLASCLPESRWTAIKTQFFAEHSCTTPFFQEIVEEFLSFLQEGITHIESDPPFMLELAHYEWLELALEITQDDETEELTCEGDWLQGSPVLSPFVVSVTYQYPVHRIGPSYQPAEPDPCYLVVYRGRDDRAGFMEINQATAIIIELLEQQSNCSGQSILVQAAQLLEYDDHTKLQEFGIDLFNVLAEKGIIQGIRSTDHK